MDNEQKYVPYAPNALIMWGVVLGFLALFTQSLIENIGIAAGGLFLAVFIAIAAYLEYHMVRKSKKNNESKELSKKHKFIENIYIFNTLYGILMTVILVKAGSINLIYVVWIFIMGFTSYTAGHILNQKSFTYHGIASAMIAFGIAYLIFFTPNGLQDTELSYLFRVLGFIIIGGGYIWLGLQMKKESLL
jgi:hypothetical protein